MSATSTYSPTSPIQRRDIRSDTLPFKRDKDASQKWSMGMRPGAGVHNILGAIATEETPKEKEKVRPNKLWSQVGNTDRHLRRALGNTTPKPFSHPSYHHSAASSSRISRKIDAQIDASDTISHPLSKSLLDLLPTHLNNTSPNITTIIPGDEGVLYSYDRKDTPNNKVDLGGLVEMAERKWVSDQTEKIVRGEYEVLDERGEAVVTGSKKGRRSPRQKAKVVEMEKVVVDEDEGFELI